jgi:RHS repeat-associated protein
VVSAQDFDMWGHPLKDRSWQADDAKYDFTGKERDTETGYDYFGARYYDSRIGRWGGVEPLLDKYISFSPYNYGMLNPLTVLDIDGNDAIITIKGNVITVDIVFKYILDNQENKNIESEYKITQSQFSDFESKINNAVDKWNTAGEDIQMADMKYKVEFKTTFVPLTTQDGADEMANHKNINGSNYISYDKDAKNPAITGQNRFKFVNTKGKVLPEYWVEHEIGHIIGLPHPTEDKNKLRSDNSVMGYNPVNHQPPTEKEVKQFLYRRNLSKSWDYVKGAKGTKH